jgi:hypothetical protein
MPANHCTPHTEASKAKMSAALTPEQIKQRLRYQGKQYSAGAFARGGAPERHYLEQAADRIQALENALLDCADDYNYLQHILPPTIDGLHAWLEDRRKKVASMAAGEPK